MDIRYVSSYILKDMTRRLASSVSSLNSSELNLVSHSATAFSAFFAGVDTIVHVADATADKASLSSSGRCGRADPAQR